MSSQADVIKKNLEAEVKTQGLEADVEVRRVGCMGFCGQGPLVGWDQNGEHGLWEFVKPEDWTPEWVKKIQNRFTIADWQNIRGGAGEELKRRDVKFKSANQVSFHILDPDGYEVQIGGVNQ